MTTANEPLAADRAFLWNLERQSPGLHIAGLAANGNGGDDAFRSGVDSGRRVAEWLENWAGAAFFAYNQLLHVGLTVDERACPDGAVLPDLLAESLDELREAAGSAPRRPVRNAPLAPRPHAEQTLET